MVIKGYDASGLLKRTWQEIGKDKVSVYAGQMAYAFFFSLFPLLLFFAALLSLVGDQGTVQGWFTSRLAAALPADVASLLGTTIQKVVFAKGAPGILSFGLITAVWSGSGVFGALRVALNDAYDVEETRPWWKQYALQLAMLAIAGVVVLGATVILLNGEGVMQWLGDHLHLGRITTLVWTVVQFPLAIAALAAVLWMVYYLLPNCRHQNKKILLFGSLLATGLWILATLLFRIYVQKFNALNPAFGAVGAIMVLLSWMYYSAFVLLAVGELNAEMEKSDSKVGASEKARAAETQHYEPVPRGRALVPAGAAARRPPEPRWAARMHADGRARDGARRGLRRFAIFRVVGRVQDSVAFTRDWVEGTIAHLRADISAARSEVGGIMRSVGVGTGTLAIGGVMALLGALSTIAGLIFLVGDQWLPRDRYWLAALVVAAIAAFAAAWFARRGRELFRAGLAPRETIDTLRDDAQLLSNKHRQEIASGGRR